MSDDMRREFEKYCGNHPASFEIRRRNDGSYRSTTELLWEFWQAAIQSLPRVTDFAHELTQRKNAMKEALCEFALALGAKFDEVTLVEKNTSDGNKIQYEYSIQKSDPIKWHELPRVTESELVEMAKVMLAAETKWDRTSVYGMVDMLRALAAKFPHIIKE
jgi:hypothetical protein